PRAQGRRLRLALRAQILDAPLDIGETAARLLLPRPRLRQPLLESRPLGQQRAGARLEPRDLVARPLPLVLQRAPRRLGIRVRRRVRLLRRARRGQGALEVGLGRRGGALGRGLQLLLRPLLARGGLAQLGRQQVALALPLAHLRRPARGRGLGLREARPELLELHRPRGRISLPLLAQRADLALQLGNLCARLHVAEAGLLQPLLEAPALGEQRARALLQLRDLVARPLLLVLERLDCALGAGERGAGALGLRVRRSACLLGGPGGGQRPLEVVLVCRRRALAGGVQPLLGALHALACLAQRGSQPPPLALGRLHPLALAGGRGLGLREARHQALDLGRALRPARLVHRGLGSRPLGALGRRRLERCRQTRPLPLRLGQRRHQRLHPRRLALVALRRGAGERERRRGGRRCRRRGGQRRRRRAPAGSLDHAGQLAQRLGERADLLLGDPLRGDRDQDDARDRCRAGVERHAGDGRDRGGRLDQRRYVAVLGRALDQVDAAVEQAVERHVPPGHAAAAYLAQALAALVREPHLCGQAEELVTLIEQAEGAGAGAARLEHGGERGLEHVLGSCGTGGDLAELLGEARERRVRDRARAGRAATTLGPGGALHATSSAPTREPSSGTTPGGQTAPAAVLPAFVGRNDRPLEARPGPHAWLLNAAAAARTPSADAPPAAPRCARGRWRADGRAARARSAGRRAGRR